MVKGSITRPNFHSIQYYTNNVKAKNCVIGVHSKVLYDLLNHVPSVVSLGMNSV